MKWPFEGVQPEIDPTAFAHPAATIIGSVKVGAGSSVWPGVSLRGDVGPITIGENTSIQDNSVVHTTGGMSISTVGSRITVGHGVILHGCTVEDDCIVGMGSIVMDNSTIPPWSIVGAGSLVPPDKKYPSGMLILGRPARAVRELTAEERAWITRSWKIYAELCAKYRYQHGQ
jgi:gamma-carbonic anhydrase